MADLTVDGFVVIEVQDGVTHVRIVQPDGTPMPEFQSWQLTRGKTLKLGPLKVPFAVANG